MQPLSIFPQTIKTPRLVLRVVFPTKENAAKILNIIEQNRDYLMEWQGHFGELKTIDDVVAYLTKRANQIKLFSLFISFNAIFVNANSYLFNHKDKADKAYYAHDKCCPEHVLTKKNL